jgi:hypothetical protein
MNPEELAMLGYPVSWKTLTGERCDQARRSHELFERLVRAAGLPDGIMSFRIRLGGSYNASLSYNKVFVDEELLELFEEDPEGTAMGFVIAHEIGHFIQSLQRRARNAHFSFSAYGSDESMTEEIRNEAHADMLAFWILSNAGYSADFQKRGQEIFYRKVPWKARAECGRLMNPGSHPTNETRRANHSLFMGEVSLERNVMFGHLLGLDAALKKSFEDGRQSLSQMYDNAPSKSMAENLMHPKTSIPITPLDFDEHGRLRAGRVLVPRIKRELPLQLSKHTLIEKAQGQTWLLMTHVAREAIKRSWDAVGFGLIESMTTRYCVLLRKKPARKNTQR